MPLRPRLRLPVPVPRAAAPPLLIALLAGTGPAPAQAAATVSAARPAVLTATPFVLPGSAAARADVRAAGGAAPGWVVGARPSARTRALAARLGARQVTALGTFVVPAARARAFADGLRQTGLLVFAEPNVRRAPRAFEAAPGGWSRGAIASPGLLAPPNGAARAAGMIDQRIDTTRPDLASSVTFLAGSEPEVQGGHGTEGASVLGAALDGEGVLGTYPGVHIDEYAIPLDFGCADSAAGIDAVRRSGVAALNMSYGSTTPCFAEFRELQYALAQGVVAVAAAGNEFSDGNPVEYPATLPHVLSVAAVAPDLATAGFSTANAAVDLAAPGEAVPVDVPLAFDTDGHPDGFTLADGTSFAAPAVTGAAAFVKAARPGLSAGQVADVLRLSATDVDRKGYDANTGYGVVNLDKALTTPAPRRDPLEPNDEIMWVDGTAFAKADRPVYDGRRRVSFPASVDQVEDPMDVYRVKLPRRSRTVISLRPSYGDPDLAVYRSSATDTAQTGKVIAASHRSGTATDRVTLLNRAGVYAITYVVVSIDRRVRNLAAGYTLTLTKQPFRW
ncbi:S8 family serine peptidase [Paraconexibacter antarcticus]|uniref:S8 family serine peptidase n=1 Tax=Paraconexibacter antarcticus TaxID=2949664 RepID=A0ABY5DUY8_9ACTN|nr:S8 family serine peptidase [Paraconexibacter antarcticus]UTI64652.1 S8 family serine peptidase [Paraconexibacter antarcticus]